SCILTLSLILNESFLCLCAVILFYVPLFLSMDLHFVLCAVISVYGPLFCSMDCYSGLLVIVLFYVPLFQSMCHRSVLWTVISIYVPSFRSMCRHPILWTVLSSPNFLLTSFPHPFTASAVTSSISMTSFTDKSAITLYSTHFHCFSLKRDRTSRQNSSNSLSITMPRSSYNGKSA